MWEFSTIPSSLTALFHYIHVWWSHQTHTPFISCRRTLWMTPKMIQWWVSSVDDWINCFSCSCVWNLRSVIIQRWVNFFQNSVHYRSLLLSYCDYTKNVTKLMHNFLQNVRRFNHHTAVYTFTALNSSSRRVELCVLIKYVHTDMHPSHWTFKIKLLYQLVYIANVINIIKSLNWWRYTFIYT